MESPVNAPAVVVNTHSSLPPVVEVDAATQTCINAEQVAAYHRSGLLIIRNLVRGEELAALQRETLPFVENALRLCEGRDEAPPWDLHYIAAMKHAQTGKMTPFRQEYPINRSEACRLLLGHPFILASVAVIQGSDFTPTWDSLVFKSPGHGAIIAWHRDGTPPEHCPTPVFNVDFYLDGSDATNCVWGIPGSNTWSEVDANAEIRRRNSVPSGFEAHGAIPLPMRPGDVLFHDVKVLHGSPWAQSALRRVLYYEFRAADVILKNGLRTEAYVKRKQRMLKSIINERASHARGRGEVPFNYAPQAGEWNRLPIPAGWKPATYQYTHEDYMPG
jgi:phytanoyl-CoA hydroxylase